MVTSHAKALRPEKTWSHLMRKHFDQKKHGHISCESTSTRKKHEHITRQTTSTKKNMVTSHAKALRQEKTWSHLMRKHFDQKKHGHISCESTSTRKNMVTSHAKALRPEET